MSVCICSFKSFSSLVQEVIVSEISKVYFNSCIRFEIIQQKLLYLITLIDREWALWILGAYVLN